MQKVALITGSGRGLGRELARRLCQHGYGVSIHAFQSLEGANTLQKELAASGHDAMVFSGDLRQTTEAQKLVDSTLQHFGRLDLLICNSGVYYGKAWDIANEVEWKEEIESTLWPTIWTCRYAIQVLRASGSGRIVCIGDSGCDRIDARKHAVGYHMAKTGLYLFVRSLAQAEAEHGVTVNMISPSILEESAFGPKPEAMPTKRRVQADEIYRAIEFLAAAESTQITGTNMIIGGSWGL